MIEFSQINPLLEAPAYSLSDAASYARVPYQTLRYWVLGRNTTSLLLPLINLPDYERPALSFLNLLECHILNAFRTRYELQIRAIRKGLTTLTRIHPSKHPLLEFTFSTDKIDLFLESTTGEITNLSRGGQIAMREILNVYLQRIEWHQPGIPKLYPFVVKDRPDEPKMVSIVPTIAFGRSVIDGTGISTAVIAARFNARETVQALAEEYGRRTEEIEEAVRWESNRTPKAA